MLLGNTRRQRLCVAQFASIEMFQFKMNIAFDAAICLVLKGRKRYCNYPIGTSQCFPRRAVVQDSSYLPRDTGVRCGRRVRVS